MPVPPSFLLTEFCTAYTVAGIGRRTAMPTSPKDIVPLTRARAKLTELCEEVRRGPTEKLITKNGESCAALIGAERLDYYHRLEREHIHLILLQEAIRGIEDLKAGKTLGLKKLRARYAR